MVQHLSWNKLIAIFNGKLPIVTTMDSQPKGLHKFHQFMVNWREKTTEYSGRFVSSKLWHDFQSMSLGIKSTVAIKQRQFPLPLKKPWQWKQWNVTRSLQTPMKPLQGDQSNSFTLSAT